MPTESFFNKNINKIISDRNKTVKRFDKKGRIVSFDTNLTESIRHVDLSERYPPSVLRNMNFQNVVNKFKSLKNTHPVLMMPIRLETKFYLHPQPPTLKIRIFPDEIMLNDHNEKLSTIEYETGRRFWEEYKKLENTSIDSEEMSNLWAWFVSQVDTDRATMIAYQSQRKIAPENLRQPEEYNISKSLLLPDRWVAVGYNGPKRVVEGYSNLIKHDLAFSPDFANSKEVANDLSVDENIKWMFDYEIAHQKGMAINLELDDETKNGIEELYVVGIKTKNPHNTSKNMAMMQGSGLMEKALHSHRLSKGAAFVPQGTPTNNTEDVESGWSAFATDTDGMWARTFEDLPKKSLGLVSKKDIPHGALFPKEEIHPDITNKDKNASVLGKALGFPENSYALSQYEYREGHEQKLMSAMNEAVWPVTYGEMVNTMLAYEETQRIGKEDKKWLKKWFINNMFGGASLPTIRIGETPYGVLPVQSFGHMNYVRMSDAQEKTLFSLLQRILPFLIGEKADQLLSMTDNPQFTDDIGDVFLELMSRHPNPVQFMLQDLSNDEFKITNWYFFVRTGITDINLPYPKRVNELISTDLERLGKKKFRTLAEQRKAYSDLKDVLKIKYNNSAWDVPESHQAYDLIQFDKKAMDALMSLTDYMLEALNSHQLRASAFDFIGAPKRMYKGVLDTKHTDPNLLFCRYDTDLKEWPEEKLVVIDKGEATVTPETYISYLQKYLDSYLDSKIEPGASPFPDNNKPLLYHLLYAAIARTSINYDENTYIMVDVIDTVKEVGFKDQSLIGKRFATTDEKNIKALSDSIAKFNAKTARTAQEKNLGITLQRTNKFELQKAASRIRSEAKHNTVNKKAMLDLANNIEKFSKSPSKIKDVKKYNFQQSTVKRDLEDLRKAMDLLRVTPWDQLELLLQQSLGLAGWRLDAWYTSFHTQRLNKLRETKPRGLQLGAYGWLHDLKPRHLDQGNKEISQGYIHTPSLNHAKTAAVLRSGWTAYQNDDAHEALSVDLSSERIRIASWLFDAVRQGQDIGDALGYRFERMLHEEGLDHWIMPVRKGVLTYSHADFDPLSPVVDGMELLNLWNKDSKQAEFERYTKPYFKGRAPKAVEIKDSINHIETALDAMGDTAIADSVHALVQGNAARAGSNLAAINRGEVPPPELNFANTQRRGRSFTHKVIMLNQTDPENYGWFRNESDFNRNNRAAADPNMERQISALIGKPDGIVFDVGFKANDKIIHRFKINLQEINKQEDFMLGALDCLSMVGDNDETINSPLEEWVLLFMHLNRPNKYRDEEFKPVIIYSDQNKGNLTNTEQTLLWLGHWRETLFKSRPLKPSDLVVNEEDAERSSETIINIEEIEERANHLLKLFSNSLEELMETLPEPTEENPEPPSKLSEEELIQRLIKLSHLGIPSAIPRLVGNEDNDLRLSILNRQIWGAYKTLAKRLTEALKVTIEKTASVEERIKGSRQIIQLLLGKTMRVLPSFKAVNTEQIIHSLAQTNERLGKSTALSPCYEWLEKMQYVKPEIRSISEALLISDLERRGPPIRFSVGQWPDIKGEPWSAISPNKLSERTYTSILAISPNNFEIKKLESKNSFIHGLFITEMIERLPETEEDTGIALHFDAPNTEPPQTMLLAMAPEGKAWDFDLMIDTLRDTLEWSRLRTIDNIPFLKNYMPAVYGPSNVFGLAPEKEDKD